jgi:hypothetical protein
MIIGSKYPSVAEHTDTPVVVLIITPVAMLMA